MSKIGVFSNFLEILSIKVAIFYHDGKTNKLASIEYDVASRKNHILGIKGVWESKIGIR